MPSTFPREYIDTADIRMLRDVLKLGGYLSMETKADNMRNLAAAIFVLGQFTAGIVDPSVLLHNLKHWRPRPDTVASKDAAAQRIKNSQPK